ncbi:MAG: hypothetical protein AAGF75_04215 [Cyanobacteria bacterium P01_H01_bin.130]
MLRQANFALRLASVKHHKTPVLPNAMADFSHLAHLLPALGNGDALHSTAHHAAEFSRAHCVKICAFLVPANLAATLQTLMMMALDRPLWQVGFMAAIAAAYATVMVLHVLTWFVVGVVMVPTYVLLSFGLACCIVNSWAVLRLWKNRHGQNRLQNRNATVLPPLAVQQNL